MKTARVFKSGNSQAVRIPKEFQFDVAEVEIFRRDDELIIRPKKENLADAFDLITGLSADFMQEGRDDEPPQERNFDV